MGANNLLHAQSLTELPNFDYRIVILPLQVTFKQMQNGNASEQHPFFPSGEWEGFYTYNVSNKGNMTTLLNFSNGVISGSGTDPVGHFEWKGQYNTDTETCYMVKKYTGMHSVYYNGQADENGIWGNWTISADWSGGFHIWPKKSNADNENAEINEEQLVLQNH